MLQYVTDNNFVRRKLWAWEQHLIILTSLVLVRTHITLRSNPTMSLWHSSQSIFLEWIILICITNTQTIWNTFAFKPHILAKFCNIQAKIVLHTYKATTIPTRYNANTLSETRLCFQAYKWSDFIVRGPPHCRRPSMAKHVSPCLSSGARWSVCRHAAVSLLTDPLVDLSTELRPAESGLEFSPIRAPERHKLIWHHLASAAAASAAARWWELVQQQQLSVSQSVACAPSST